MSFLFFNVFWLLCSVLIFVMLFDVIILGYEFVVVYFNVVDSIFLFGLFKFVVKLFLILYFGNLKLKLGVVVGMKLLV